MARGSRISKARGELETKVPTQNCCQVTGKSEVMQTAGAAFARMLLGRDSPKTPSLAVILELSKRCPTCNDGFRRADFRDS